MVSYKEMLDYENFVTVIQQIGEEKERKTKEEWRL